MKQHFPGCEVIGIEMLDKAAAMAAQAYDRVIAGTFEQVDFETEGLIAGSFDTIIAADVLGHIYNPWQALQRQTAAGTERGNLCQSAQRAQPERAVRVGIGRMALSGSGHPRYYAHPLLHAGAGRRNAEPDRLDHRRSPREPGPELGCPVRRKESRRDKYDQHRQAEAGKPGPNGCGRIASSAIFHSCRAGASESFAVTGT